MHTHTHTGTVEGMSSTGLRRTHVLLTDEQYRRLHERSEATTRSVSQLIREAVDEQIGRAPGGRGEPFGFAGGGSAARRFLAAQPLSADAETA